MYRLGGPASRLTPRFAVLLAVLAATSCDESDVSAEELDTSPLSFVDVAAQAGIDVVNVAGDPRKWYIPESNGCGAAWLDYDGDGDMDLFVANGSGMVYHDDGARLEVTDDGESRLYRNDGHLRFTDVTEEAGALRTDWINGVATGDADGDGDVDLYLACFGADVYLRNDGGRFVDATTEAGLGNELWGAAAAFGDVDHDGDLDLYVSNYVDFDPANPPDGGKRAVFDGVEVAYGPEGEFPGINLGAPDRFYRNAGDGTFEEATEAAGFALEKALCSYACVFSDVTGDGWIDLLVANDVQPCNLFVNQRDGTFRDEAVERGFAFDGAGEPTSAMGFFVDDVDMDGDFDVLRTNFDFEPNSLHVNDGHGNFTEKAGDFGLADPSVERLGWGGGFFDMDCDGDLDLLVANGHVMPQATEVGMNGWLQQTQLFEATPYGDAVVYADVTERAGDGFAPLRSSRGVALGDPDDDGDIDALIIDLDAPPRLLENRSERKGHWLSVDLRAGASNGRGAACTGAVVRVHADGRTWTREARTEGGLFSAHDPRLHFGLGPVHTIDKVVVRWPDRTIQTIEAPAPDQFLVITKAE